MQSLPSRQRSPMTAPGCRVRAIADHGVLADIGERIDRHVLTDPGRRRDAGLGMNARPARLRCSPFRWVRTARNAAIGSSTSMTARLSPASCGRRLKCGPTIAAEAGEVRQQLGEPLALDERDVARPGFGDRSRRADRRGFHRRPSGREPVPRVVPPLRPRAFSFLP